MTNDKDTLTTREAIRRSLDEALSRISAMVAEVEFYTGYFGNLYAPNWSDVQRVAEEIWQDQVAGHLGEGHNDFGPVLRALADVSTSDDYRALVALRSKVNVSYDGDYCECAMCRVREE